MDQAGVYGRQLVQSLVFMRTSCSLGYGKRIGTQFEGFSMLRCVDLAVECL